MAADAMVLSDENGIVLAANPAYLRLYGYTAEQIIGHSFAIIFPEAVRGWAVDQYRQYFASDDTAPVVESTIVRADGTQRIVESRVGYITEAGQRTAMLSIIRDVTDRKHLVEGLQQARQTAESAALRLARLQAVTAAFSQALTPPEVTRIILEQGLPAVDAAAGLVMLVSADGTALEVVAHQGYDPAEVAVWDRLPLDAPRPMDDAVRTRSTLFFDSPETLHRHYPPTNLEPAEHVAWAVLPLCVDERVVGAVGLSFAAAHAFNEDERAFLDTLAAQCAQALDRARLYEVERQARASLEERVEARTAELVRAKRSLETEMAGRRQVEQQLEQAREAERTRLARELHDGLGGALTGLKMDLAQLQRSLPPDAHARLGEMLGLVDETVNIMRRIAADLRPAVLDDLGIVSAIEWQAAEFQRRSSLPCRVITNVEDLDLEPRQAIAVFRIVQEALTNILRHARATAVEVRLNCEGDVLSLAISDDGQGITPERRHNATSLGLAGMRERVRLLGGQLQIEGATGRGTTVRVEIPLSGAG